MTYSRILFAAAALTLAVGGPALAADPPEERAQERIQERTQAQTAAQTRSELGVTMRIIDDPAALGGEMVTRRISLPPVLPVEDDENAELVHTGERVSEQARERGREFGVDVAERAREMGEEARERREDFGRSRAEEARPERPRPPRPPGP